MLSTRKDLNRVNGIQNVRENNHLYVMNYYNLSLVSELLPEIFIR